MILEKVGFYHRHVIVEKVQSMVKLGFALTNFMQYDLMWREQFQSLPSVAETVLLQSQKVYSYTLTARTLTLSRLSISLHHCTAHSYFLATVTHHRQSAFEMSSICFDYCDQILTIFVYIMRAYGIIDLWVSNYEVFLCDHFMSMTKSYLLWHFGPFLKFWVSMKTAVQGH